MAKRQKIAIILLLVAGIVYEAPSSLAYGTTDKQKS